MGEEATCSALASRLFPQACPPYLPPDAIECFIAENLSEQVFKNYLKDPGIQIVLAEIDAYETAEAQNKLPQWQPVGYTLIEAGSPGYLPPEENLVKATGENCAYLSKCYVEPQWYGSGLSGAMLEVSHFVLQKRYPHIVKIGLGTNLGNRRARKFYRRHGYRKCGQRIFMVADIENQDLVAVRDFTTSQIPSWAKNVAQ